MSCFPRREACTPLEVFQHVYKHPNGSSILITYSCASLDTYCYLIQAIKAIKFNNKHEDWTEFDLKLKAIADERGYDEILEGTLNVPRDTDMSGGEANAQVKAANKRGYRDLILATKDTLLTMVSNTKTDALPQRGLYLAWKKLEKRRYLKSREDKIDSLAKFIQQDEKHLNETPRLDGTYGKKEE